MEILPVLNGVHYVCARHNKLNCYRQGTVSTGVLMVNDDDSSGSRL